MRLRQERVKMWSSAMLGDDNDDDISGSLKAVLPHTCGGKSWVRLQTLILLTLYNQQKH
jgi:hypothetical protein